MGKRNRPEVKTKKYAMLNTNFSNSGRGYRSPDFDTFFRPPESFRHSYQDVYVHSQEYENYSWFGSNARQYKKKTQKKPQSLGSNVSQYKKKTQKKSPSRPPTPVLGSEEYMVKKIQETSAIIMRQLLNPDEQLIPNTDKESASVNDEFNEVISKQIAKDFDKSTGPTGNKSKKKVTPYDIEQIHKKIMSHITNLNDGKKKNLVNANSTSYDIAIQQIQKQKRLEVSRALRNVCSHSQQQESTDFINSIIPDIGIKIEDLPHDVIEELTNTLNLDGVFEDDTLSYSSQGTCYFSISESRPQRESVLNNPINEPPQIRISIKAEPIDEIDVAVFDSNISNKEIEAVTIKVEDIQHNSTKKQTTSECSEETYTAKILDKSVDKFIPDIDVKNIEDVENNIGVKQEVVEFNYTMPELSYESESPSVTETENNVLLPKSQENPEEILVDKEKYGIPFIKPNEIINGNNLDHSNLRSYTDAIIQTEENLHDLPESFADKFLTAIFKRPPEDLSEAITRMFQIDQCISKLTEYRQSLFNNLSESKSSKCNAIEYNGRNGIGNVPFGKVSSDKIILVKKRSKQRKRKANKLTTEKSKKSKCEVTLTNEKQDETCIADMEDDTSRTNKCQTVVEETKTQNLLQFQDTHEKMLVIKVVRDKLVAGAESGKVYTYSLEDGHCSYTFEASKVPITALLFNKVADYFEMYVGSFENNLKAYDLNSHRLLKTINIDDSVQCMESSWGYIFVGCIRGSLLRYSIKKGVIEYDDKLSDNRILVLKATQEGARRILVVGSHNSPLCIRDAMTGLYMRTMENVISLTVYSLLLEKSQLYCGTTSHDIVIFSFHDGKLVTKYDATNSKGVGCMKILNNLLFASCHNGNIYVYDTKANKFIDSIQGPGGVILSMEVLENQVIIGTMSYKFTSIPIPEHILNYKI